MGSVTDFQASENFCFGAKGAGSGREPVLRRGIGYIGGVKVREDAKYALLLLLFNLLLSNFSFREYDLHIRCGGGNSKHDRRNKKSLARVHDSGNQFGFKPRGANRELERAWSKIVKGKLPIVARQHIL